MPKLALVQDTPATVTRLADRRPTGDTIALPARVRELDKARDRATEKALSPDVADDLRENVAKLLGKLAKNPGDLQGLLYDFGRHMYVAGRMDQVGDDQLARTQTDALADAAMAQVLQLVHRPHGGDVA